MNATGVTREEVAVVIDAHPGFRGVANVRAVLDLVDGGAESPQESRLRLLLVEAGLPRPETQIVFRDLRIRVDLGWRRWKVAVEYDASSIGPTPGNAPGISTGSRYSRMLVGRWCASAPR